MRKPEDYVKMLQPKEEDKAILMYGSRYRLWLPGDYIGTAIWVHDDRLGDSFQNRVVISEDKKQLIN